MMTDVAETHAAIEEALLRRAFAAAVAAVSADAVMPRQLPQAAGRLAIVAMGKAGAAMMRAACARLGAGAEGAAEGAAQAVQGIVVVPPGHLCEGLDAFPGVEVILAGHPYPDEGSLRAGARILDLAASLGPRDHLLLLLSGGGSALVAAPADGVDLAAKAQVTRALLQSGAGIAEINCVRKHLSRIKGGRLALAAAPAPVTTWLVSDIPGDEPAFVASGPTIARAGSLADARAILARHGIAAPAAVVAALDDPANEAPLPDDPAFAVAEVAILARARDALDAAGALLAGSGYALHDLGDDLEAEARLLGADHARKALALAESGARAAILSGGECTVVVRNRQGRGGRNLEYLLALAISLDGAPGIHALAGDTDGIDGTENAAGAVVRPDTLERARALGLDPQRMLDENNAYLFFEALGDLVVTGPTLTNVNDFRLILVEGGGG